MVKRRREGEHVSGNYAPKPTFRKNVLPQSPVSSSLQMEATIFSQIFAPIYQSTRRHIENVLPVRKWIL